MKKTLALSIVLAACGGAQAAPSAHTIPPAAGASAPIRWAIAACPLRYEMTTVEESAMTEPAGAEGVVLDTFVTVDAQPAAGAVELAAAVSSRPRTAKFRSFNVADADFAAVHLTTDGKRWIERDGPTFLYTRMGTQGGLDWFFPDLPESGAPGASASWRIDEGDSALVQATEAARGRHKDIAPPDAQTQPGPPPLVATVRLERWSELQGARVAELSMSAARETSDGPPEARSHVKETIRGTYSVLASGRLLSAEIERDALLELASRFDDKTSVQHHKQHAKRRIHLVSACDGPTAGTLATPLTREERAIDAWGKATVALFKNDREGMLAALDPELRKKWGDAKLWSTFEEIRNVRGERAISPPLLLSDQDLSADSAAVRVVTRGLVPDRKQANVVNQHSVTVTLREVEGRFVASSLVGETTSGDQESTFEISRDRLVVRH
jgi:hypothetical protein